eukprot:TRINITY_DN56057_c0_g1_i1.p1 TRINITY_DN56057_c0_g1~~TRINITY_DN56057_c0_g1_i1.p1  ORF type:complete len:682 (+),score=216.29 TRINITY_DN56057_c0_g1_i1:88-2046(+)
MSCSSLEDIRMHQRHQLLQIIDPPRDKGKKKRVLVVDPSLVPLFAAVLLGEDARLEEAADAQKKGAKGKAPLPPQTLAEYFAARELEHFLEGPTKDVFAGELKQKHILYFARHSLELLKRIADDIGEAVGARGPQIDIYVVPRLTLLVEHFAQERKLQDSKCFVHELDLDLVPLETDVMSMECPDALRDLAVAGDPSLIFPIAKALTKLQVYLGTTAAVRAKGEAAVQVARVMHRMKAEAGDLLSGQKPAMSCIYIFDRRADLATPLLTQPTYEGLIDEVLGTKDRCVMVEEDSESPVAPYRLTAEDSVFAKIRDTNWRVTGKTISKLAKEIKAFEDSRSGLTALKEIKNFMRELPEKQKEKKRLYTHLNISKLIREGVEKWGAKYDAEQIIMCGHPRNTDKENLADAVELLDECFCRGDIGVDQPIEGMDAEGARKAALLRMFCLFSAANGGVDKKNYLQWKEKLVHYYGPRVLLELDNLEAVGLLRMQGQKGNTFAVLKRDLRLLRPEAFPGDAMVAKELSDVGAGPRKGQGYAPPLCRVVDLCQSDEASSDRKWAELEPVLGLMDGPMYPARDDEHSAPHRAGGGIIVVFFVGGVTYSEIAALRFLEGKLRAECPEELSPPQFIIGATSILNGGTLMESVTSWEPPREP